MNAASDQIKISADPSKPVPVNDVIILTAACPQCGEGTTFGFEKKEGVGNIQYQQTPIARVATTEAGKGTFEAYDDARHTGTYVAEWYGPPE